MKAIVFEEKRLMLDNDLMKEQKKLMVRFFYLSVPVVAFLSLLIMANSQDTFMKLSGFCLLILIYGIAFVFSLIFYVLILRKFSLFKVFITTIAIGGVSLIVFFLMGLVMIFSWWFGF